MKQIHNDRVGRINNYLDDLKNSGKIPRHM